MLEGIRLPQHQDACFVMIPVSLGFSCQSKFIIDAGSAPWSTLPFDWAITTRSFLLECLRDDGQSFHISEANASSFTMTTSGRSGISTGAIYYWHDFPLQDDKLQLAETWRERIPSVNEQYARRWARLKVLLRDANVRKHIFISNSQLNLTQFVADDADFLNKFGLDEAFFVSVLDALKSFQAKNFKIIFFVRTFADYQQLLKIQAKLPDLFSVRFAGEMSSSGNKLFAASIFMEPMQNIGGDISLILGRYANGVEILKANDIALVYKRAGVLWAEATSLPGGYLFVFAGENKVFTARLLGQQLQFSNKTSWAKV